MASHVPKRTADAATYTSPANDHMITPASCWSANRPYRGYHGCGASSSAAPNAVPGKAAMNTARDAAPRNERRPANNTHHMTVDDTRKLRCSTPCNHSCPSAASNNQGACQAHITAACATIDAPTHHAQPAPPLLLINRRQ